MITVVLIVIFFCSSFVALGFKKKRQRLRTMVDEITIMMALTVDCTAEATPAKVIPASYVGTTCIVRIGIAWSTVSKLVYKPLAASEQ